MIADDQGVRWEHIKQRMRRSALASGSAQARDAERRNMAYRQRAARFAASATIAPEGALTKTAMFRLSDQQYGIPLKYVVKAFPRLACIPVPSSPPWLLGVANFESQVRSVLDLRLLVEGTAARDVAAGNILLVQAGVHLVGLQVDELMGVCEVDLDGLTALESRDGEHGRALLRGSISNGTRIIHIEALAATITR